MLAATSALSPVMILRATPSLLESGNHPPRCRTSRALPAPETPERSCPFRTLWSRTAALSRPGRLRGNGWRHGAVRDPQNAEALPAERLILLLYLFQQRAECRSHDALRRFHFGTAGKNVRQGAFGNHEALFWLFLLLFLHGLPDRFNFSIPFQQ